ncbi:MAG: nucleoside-diphosphate sugar epimerase/dehydratase [Tepidisphaeraceae bacterium]
MPKALLRKLTAAIRPSRSRAVVQRSIAPVDLLGRTPINLDTPELQRFLAGKRVLVTGAGGSIGSEICRQAMKFCPASLVMIDRSENALFEIDRELRDQWLGADLRPLVADVGDAARVAQIFDQERPQVVFHAAAHKHVPMMEANPGEAIKNNVLGTKTVADASLAAGVTAFVLISTDKAVNPTSVMGATKRVAELYIQSLNSGLGLGAWGLGKNEDFAFHQAPSPKPQAPSTRFVAVRFGNVLGSSGSVVPIFARQIAAGGPVTITDARMRRYFMTIPEASQLVMQAGAIGQGGEIFVLDMGEPVKILDLAEEMIRRQGLVVGKDIRIKVTGMRPGEKLFEELANDSDQTAPTSHPKIQVWNLPRSSPTRVARMIDDLTAVIESPKAEILAALGDAVPEFAPPEAARPMPIAA